MMRYYKFFQSGLFLFMLLIGATLIWDGCARNPVTGKKQLMLMSPSQELAMGKQADPSIVAQFGLYQDESLQNFLNRKGQKMARISHLPDLDYEFKLLDSPVVNAFAVPGGFVYFTRGIMAHFNNEAQFAGVLGHEIGHITARHSARQQTRSILAQVALIGGMVVAPEFAQFGNQASQGLQLLLMKYGRDAESESDKLGVLYSSEIGYDAVHMADFFGTLDRLTGGPEGRIPTFMSTHPDPADRNNKVRQMATDWQKSFGSNRRRLEVGRSSYLQMIDGMVYGEDPRQGFVENSNFYHPELKFQYPIPRGWQTANSPQQVQMAPEDGKAMILLQLARGASLDAAAQAAAEQYGLRTTSSQRRNVNGMNALEVYADLVPQQQQGQQQQQQAQQQAIKTVSYYIQYGELIYHFIGVSAEADFRSYESRMLRTMQGFKTLTDPALLNRQPDRLKIQTVSRSMTLQDALTNFRQDRQRFNELAILNGMELNQRLEAGTLIKTVSRNK